MPQEYALYALAIALTICAGFRAFVPLFVLSLSLKIGLLSTGSINPVIAPYLAGNDMVLFILGFLALMEILVDKSESMGNFVDAVNLILRPLVGGVIIFTFFIIEDPIFNYLATLVLGIFLTVPFHSLKANARFLSQDLHYSAYNIYLSLTLDLEAMGVAVLSIFSPLIGVFCAPIIFLITLQFYRKWKTKLVERKEKELTAILQVTGNANIFDSEKAANPQL